MDGAAKPSSRPCGRGEKEKKKVFEEGIHEIEKENIYA
jgi:hypothetical protein